MFHPNVIRISTAWKIGRAFSDNAQAIIVKALERVLLYLAAILIVLVVTFPFLWMIGTSLKPRNEMFVIPPTLLPAVPTLDNYIFLLTQTRFALWFQNSVIVALASTLFSMIVSSFGAYALSRFRFVGFLLFSRGLLLAYLIPSIMLVIPLYSFMVDIGLANSLQSLVITNITFTLPFTLWLLRSYFAGISPELEQAAMIDGCTRFQAFWKVILPLALPGLVATSIFAFTRSWNEFLYATVFITSDSLRTLPPGMASFILEDTIYQWGVLMAGSVLVALPALVFYAIVQRNLVVDLTAGGVKE